MKPAALVATLTANATNEATARRERQEEQRLEMAALEERRQTELQAAEERRRSELAEREERRHDRQMNMFLMVSMMGMINPNAAAAMQPMQNHMLQQMQGNTSNSVPDNGPNQVPRETRRSSNENNDN